MHSLQNLVVLLMEEYDDEKRFRSGVLWTTGLLMVIALSTIANASAAQDLPGADAWMAVTRLVVFAD